MVYLFNREMWSFGSTKWMEKGKMALNQTEKKKLESTKEAERRRKGNSRYIFLNVIATADKKRECCNI